jgi:hypothetical protein
MGNPKNPDVRLTRAMIDRLAQQTPCLCGSIDTWHRNCYAGKTPGQLRDARTESYKIAAAELKRRNKLAAEAVIALVSLK